jgi:alanine racemase
MKEAYLTWAEIDLDAIDYNVRQLKRMLGPAVLLTAVVKGEAYGHGPSCGGLAARGPEPAARRC